MKRILMSNKTTDILIVGAGLAGLSATALFTKAGFSCICIDPNKPPSNPNNCADKRSTAFLFKSIELFKKADLWQYLEKYSEPIKIMRITNLDSATGKKTSSADFQPGLADLSEFGFNIPNSVAKFQITKNILATKKASLIFGEKVVNLCSRSEESIAILSNGSKITAKLIIAADGKNSRIRKIANIKTKSWTHDQKAIAFSIIHENAHNGISTEFYKAGGPCTLVPLRKSDNGEHQSAVVWMDNASKIDTLLSLSREDLSQELLKRTNFSLFSCSVNSEIDTYPIVSSFATELISSRLALIAEAAHSLPPIGAQGLNTSFEDISELYRQIIKFSSQKKDIGSEELLKAYQRNRLPKILATIAGVELLNRTSKSKMQTVSNFRGKMINFLSDNLIAKKLAMQIGLNKFR